MLRVTKNENTIKNVYGEFINIDDVDFINEPVFLFNVGANRCGDTIDGWTNTGSKGDEGCDNLTPNNLFYKETDSFTLNKDTTIDNNEACFVNSLFVFSDKRDTDEWKEMKAILLPREYIYANRIGQRFNSTQFYMWFG